MFVARGRASALHGSERRHHHRPAAALRHHLDELTPRGDGTAGVVLLRTIVGLLAALGPAREGLRIQPTEALREASH